MTLSSTYCWILDTVSFFFNLSDVWTLCQSKSTFYKYNAVIVCFSLWDKIKYSSMRNHTNMSGIVLSSTYQQWRPPGLFQTVGLPVSECVSHHPPPVCQSPSVSAIFLPGRSSWSTWFSRSSCGVSQQAIMWSGNHFPDCYLSQPICECQLTSVNLFLDSRKHPNHAQRHALDYNEPQLAFTDSTTGHMLYCDVLFQPTAHTMVTRILRLRLRKKKNFYMWRDMRWPGRLWGFEATPTLQGGRCEWCCVCLVVSPGIYLPTISPPLADQTATHVPTYARTSGASVSWDWDFLKGLFRILFFYYNLLSLMFFHWPTRAHYFVGLLF